MHMSKPFDISNHISFFGIFAVQRSFVLLALGLTLLATPMISSAASLNLDPSTGTFVVGSTFEVPIYVGTDNEAINAINIQAKFPPDKLQLVSPSAGKSVITLWTEQPSYNNQNGSITLQGVIPNGLMVGKGLVTTLTFRVKAPGDAYVKFLGDTKILRHDGLGTDVLRETNGAVYHLILPPPAGPVVASQTHPDPSVIYRSNSVLLSWTPEDSEVSNYSYMLSSDAVDMPDDEAEGNKTSVLYKNLNDGRYFFHIKAFRNGAWGGVTHFQINIDTNPPAVFSLAILPSERILRNKQSIVQFGTTDGFSGIDHYEINVVPLKPVALAATNDDQPIFIEATSPYVLQGKSETGKYDIIVRAFDKAGNFQEAKGQLKIVMPLFGLSGESGIEIGDNILIPWWMVLTVLILGVIILMVIAVETRRRHRIADRNLTNGLLPISITTPAAQLEEKKKQYLNITQLVVALLFLAASFIGGVPEARAQSTVNIDPPIITSLSRNIGNDEIFYIGGSTSIPDATVVVFLQNMSTGETYNLTSKVERSGEWFYRHDRFLAAGDYILWAQARIADQTSPPSPQEHMSVKRTALQFGSTRLSYEFVFGVLALFLLLIIACLFVYISYHARLARAKHVRWMKEVNEAEESIRTGFAVLKRDIESELSFVRKSKLSGMLRAEELGKEEQLLRDLAWVEQNITKEVIDIEKNLEADAL